MSDERNRELDQAVAELRRRARDAAEKHDLSAFHQRLLRDLRQPSRRRAPARTIGLWAAGLAAAAAIVLLAIGLRQPTPPTHVGRLVAVAGQVEITGDLEGASAELTLAADARIDIALATDAQLVAQGPAELTLRAGRPVTLLAGRAFFEVAPRGGREPFVVSAGDTEVVVIGTRFGLEVDGGTLQAAHVSRGTIELHQGKATARRRLSAGTGTGNTERLSAAEPFSVPWWPAESVPQGPGDLWLASDNTAALVHEVAGSGEMHLLGPTPLHARLTAGDYRFLVRAPGYDDEEVEVVLAPGSERRLNVTLTPTTPERTPLRATKRHADCARLAIEVKRGKTEADRAQSLRLLAECRLRQDAKLEALELFATLARDFRGTPQAEGALFEAARLAGEVGQGARALTLLDRYLERFPSGRYRPAASFRKCELLLRASKWQRGEACLWKLRRDHPDTARTPEALFLLADVAGHNEDWKHAALLYRQYLTDAPNGRRAEEAAYRLAVVSRRGSLPGAQKAVRRYLSRYPNGKHAAESEESTMNRIALAASCVTWVACGRAGFSTEATELTNGIPNDTPPLAAFEAAPRVGFTGETFQFSARLTEDREESLEYLDLEWDWDLDGVADASGIDSSHVFSTPGRHTVSLRARDSSGLVAFASGVVVVSGSAIIVDSTADTELDDGATTLREAVELARSSGGNTTIGFAGPLTVQLENALPRIPDHTDIVGGPGVVIDGSGIPSAATINDCLRLDGSGSGMFYVTVRGCPDDGVAVRGDRNLVVGCVFEDNVDQGVDVAGTNTQIGPYNLIRNNGKGGMEATGVAVVIEGNRIEGNGDAAINLTLDASGTHIVGNLILENEAGVFVDPEVTATHVDHNTFVDTALDAITFAAWDAGSRIVNNIVSGSGDAGVVLVGADPSANVHPNLFSGILGSDCVGCSLSSSDVTTAPEFSDAAAADFRLTRASPAVDAGTMLGYDHNGAWPGTFNGAAPDLGALESAFDGN